MSALASRLVVVTRPAGQAQALVNEIEARGARAVLLPLLAIEPVADASGLGEVAASLSEFHFACFVSQNAVEHACRVLLAARTWPRGVRAVALGPSSARMLAARGVADVILPAGPFDSETLLQHPALQAAELVGKKVVIFRGDGGRALLGDTLRARGATVDYVQCYRRVQTAIDVSMLGGGGVSALTITSSEALAHLTRAVAGAGFGVWEVPMFVPHERIARAAARSGWRKVVLTEPGDAGLVAGMEQYFAAHSV